jgi:hypothetical protein
MGISKPLRFVVVRLAAAIALLLPCWALADGIGQIKVSTGAVTIERAGRQLPATVGATVYQSDRIVTGKDGAVGLSFADSAMLSAGPNTVLVLDQFAFDPYTRKGSFDVSLKRGTLSAIAGKLVSETPGSMRVRTPSAVLGVRGTEFVAQVGDVAK